MILNRRVQLFISASESGSFSKTAKEFYLSQPAVSQQIAQLEEELGVVLFDRSGYRPVLTEAGTFYYTECKKIQNQYKQIEEQAREIARKSRKTLSIGITGPLEKKHLPFIMKEYEKRCQDVTIEVKKIKFGDGVKQLEKEKLDVCFGIQNDFKGKTQIQEVNLFRHQVCVICSQEHEWAGRQSVESGELKNQPIISFSRNLGEQFYQDFLKSFEADGIKPHIVREVDELEELLLSVRLNQGIALVSREVVEDSDGICMLDIKHSHHQAYFCTGYLKKNNKPFVKEFVTVTKQYFDAQ